MRIPIYVAINQNNGAALRSDTFFEEFLAIRTKARREPCSGNNAASAS